MIPKIMHQIWVGKSPIPEVYKESVSSWKKHNPDWEYRLWDDDSLDNENFKSKRLYNKYKNKCVVKSDICRYEVVAKYGGFYADIDMIFIKPFNDLIGNRFVGTYGTNNGIDEAYNFIFGSEPNYQIVQNLVDALDDSGFDPDGDYINFFRFCSSYYYSNIVLRAKDIKRTMFGPEYFCPFPGTERNGGDYKRYISEKTYAVHLWATTWREQFK